MILKIQDVTECVEVVHDEVVNLSVAVLRIDPFSVDPGRHELGSILDQIWWGRALDPL